MSSRLNSLEYIEDLSTKRPLLVVFLRHFGCPFCRETLSNLAKNRRQIEIMGIEIVVVHMVSNQLAQQLLHLYDLDEIVHIPDPKLKLYESFGLGKVHMLSMFNPRNMLRTFHAAFIKGHLFGRVIGNPYQMPGLFLLHNKKIVRRLDFKRVSEQPDILKFVD